MTDSWRESANCKGSGVNFYVNQHNLEAMEKALALCARCEVEENCLKENLEIEKDFPEIDINGVAGGKTANQRYQIIRSRRREAKGLEL